MAATIEVMYSLDDYFNGNTEDGQYLMPILRDQPRVWNNGFWPGRPEEYTLRLQCEAALKNEERLRQWFDIHSEYRCDARWLNARSNYCNGGGLLWQSITYNHPIAVVAFLLSLRHVDVNLSNPAMCGYTPLEMALGRRRWDVVQLLLQHPAINVNISSRENEENRDGSALLLYPIDGRFIFISIKINEI